eukprot:COSAG01_NODE_60148_length_296_cov_0.786802_1_plen_35_part_01
MVTGGAAPRARPFVAAADRKIAAMVRVLLDGQDLP